MAYDYIYSPLTYFASSAILFVFAVYFLYMALRMLLKTNKIMMMPAFDFMISVGSFMVPGALVVVFLVMQLIRNGGIAKIDASPMTKVESQVLAYASLTLWCNLLYFGRMWEFSGQYVILFRYFMGGVSKFIFLIVVFMLIAADYFFLIGSSNTKVDPLTDGYHAPPFATLYGSIKASIFWGFLAQDDLSGINNSDSKV